MKKLLVFVCLLSLFGCKTGCWVDDTVNQYLPARIASTLNCKRLDIIQEDVDAWMKRKNLCPEKGEVVQTGGIAMLVCPIVVNLGVNYLAGKIPARWECDPVLAVTGAKAVLTGLCNVLPF